jgi:HNH endonuclease
MLTNITAEYLRSVLDYDPSTGIFTRKIATRKSRVGDVVGAPAERGLIVIGLMIDGKWRTYKAHRLAWLHYYGEWPSMDVDHENNKPSNNWISNLRLATDSQNLGNMRKPITNKSGKKGVSWHAIGKKWQAHVRIEGVNQYLGLFDTVDAAHAAYCATALQGRGEFARFE